MERFPGVGSVGSIRLKTARESSDARCFPLRRGAKRSGRERKFSGAPCQLLRCRNVPQLRKPLCQRRCAVTVPEIIASVPCRGCSARLRTELRRRALLLTDASKAGTRSLAPQHMSPSSERPCSFARAGSLSFFASGTFKHFPMSNRSVQ
jgi:hypothetical protein